MKFTGTDWGDDGGVSFSMSIIPPRNERKLYASIDGGASWELVKDGFDEPTELDVAPSKGAASR